MISRLAALGRTDFASEMTITSAQRGSRYTVVAVGGPVDARAVRRLAAHIGGLLDAGTRHLVVDLSRVQRVDDRLLDLMRRVEARMSDRNGVFELTGLRPSVMHAMDDEALTEVFTVYRAVVDAGDARAMTWATVQCPIGLAEVSEPNTSGRHRSIIDMGSHNR
jgi:anti-sigma B factor antagonist